MTTTCTQKQTATGRISSVNLKHTTKINRYGFILDKCVRFSNLITQKLFGRSKVYCNTLKSCLQTANSQIDDKNFIQQLTNDDIANQ
jgi:hypothetical protein